jgi:hypothetical protein
MGHQVHARGGIGDKTHIVGLGAEKGRQALPRLFEQIGRSAPQECHGVAFHLELPLPLRVEDHSRAGTKRAVVEKDKVRVEDKLIFHGSDDPLFFSFCNGGVGNGWALSAGVLSPSSGPSGRCVFFLDD